ncbi:MAG: hypothetical protein R3C45_17830 [Phycisphaerales bacterium]
MFRGRDWNNSYPDPFTKPMPGDDQAVVQVLGTRTRPIIEPWPFPGDPVLTTTTVPVGQSIAHAHAIEARADAIKGWDVEAATSPI